MFLKNVDVVEDDICILKVIKLLIPNRAEPCMWIAYKILRSAKKTIASCNNQDSRATMVI
jgi:hypothetical protein